MPEEKYLYNKLLECYFQLLNAEGDRGSVLTASAFIEHELSIIMKKRFPPIDHSKDDPFFDSYGVLRNFEDKLKFAYRFKILTHEEMSFFDSFRKNIRNPFAHNFQMITLENVKPKLIGIIQGFSELNEEVKRRMTNTGLSIETIPARYLFNTAMALVMTDLSFFNMEPRFFKVKLE